MPRRSQQPVPSITSAPAPLSEDVSGRTKRYVISMSVRTVCFLAAIFTPGPLRFVLIVGAVVLPYVAVVLANAGREPNRSDAPPAFLPDGGHALPGGTPQLPPAPRPPVAPG